MATARINSGEESKRALAEVEAQLRQTSLTLNSTQQMLIEQKQGAHHDATLPPFAIECATDGECLCVLSTKLVGGELIRRTVF